MIKSKEPGKQTTVVAGLAFPWRHILLPVLILAVAIILTAYFYRLLPAEVGYHFETDGSPDRWLSRGVFILWMLVPQLFLTLLAGAITWGATRLTVRFRQPDSTGIKPERILSLMGNMIALPQIILGFAMLDIFSYNSYQVHLLPLWMVALIVMVLGGIILGLFFIQAIRQAWGASR